MAEHSIMSFRDKFLALRKRHEGHLERAGEAAEMVGQTIVATVGGFGMGVIDQKFGTVEPAYPNLHLAKVGPVPLSMLAGAAGLGLAIYGHGKKWAPWAESFGQAGSVAYATIQGRRMTVDWMKANPATKPAGT